MAPSLHTISYNYLQDIANSPMIQAFENTSTNIAAAQMRNALTGLSETVKDPEEKKVSMRNIPEGNAKCR